MTNKLEEYREEIVSLNYQILDLLSKRGELAQKIGEEKIKQGTQVKKFLKPLLIYKNLKMKNIYTYHEN